MKIFQKPVECPIVPSGAYREWYVVARGLANQAIEALKVEGQTGAIVLDVCRAVPDSDRHKDDVELLLWGTTEQLAAAQEKFRLQSAQDALLDRAELYWG